MAAKNVQKQTSPLTRRALLSGAGALGGATLLPVTTIAQQSAANGGSDSPTVEAHTDTGLVRTTTGQVAGFRRNGIFTYKGIPYAASTEGEARFAAPRTVPAWTGIRSSRSWGPLCPQPNRGDGRSNDEETFLFDWEDFTARIYAAGAGEDCLRLNIWTPGLHDSTRRPVLFWIHGGGYTNGSSHEQPAYDGENLSRFGDVVVVSVNHRLGALGFLDLSAYGERYADSANLGMLDLVAALGWVRDNIAAFGGDNGNVTIFGQSGGGSKVCALMGMPAAKGLFHRAVAESGSLDHAMPPERSRRLAAEVVAELGLTRANVAQIQTVSADTLVRAAAAVLARQGPATAGSDRLGFGPVADGKHFPVQAAPLVASTISADIPFLVGSTLNEFTTAMNHPELAAMTEDEFRTKVQAAHGSHTEEVLAAFRAAMPQATPFQRWSVINSVPTRTSAIRQAIAKAALHRAPAYLYWFVWQSPMFEGRPGAFHCSEIAFVFHNTDRCDTMTGGGARPRMLADKVSGAWLQFARNGDPNGPGLPRWPPFAPETVPTMIFDDVCRCENKPYEGARRAALQNSSKP